MFKLMVSNGLDIETTDYKTEEEAKEAMKVSYENMGEDRSGWDSSWIGESSAFHQGEDEANYFLIEEIPDAVEKMSAREIFEKMSESEKEELLALLKDELEEDIEEER